MLIMQHKVMTTSLPDFVEFTPPNFVVRKSGFNFNNFTHS